MTGVSSDDFNQVLNDLKRSVTYKAVVKSNDSFTGDETSTFAVGTSKDVVFFKEDQRWLFDKDGITEMGDAYIMASPDLGIKRYDQFVISPEGSFYVKEVVRRFVAGVPICDYGTCFKVA
jgi:hypothetical protein